MGIKKKIKAVLARMVPKSIKWEIERSLNFLINENNEAAKFLNVSFSQEGEDIILNRFLGSQKNGFYVDIGAHHPMRFSNTYGFYLKGWHGINLDAMPGSMEPFKKLRPKDINLEVAVSDKEQILTYHIFNEPALNTFSKEEAEKKNGLRDFKIIKEIQLKTFTLKHILDNYLPANAKVDFLTIDVEGLDFAVLRSNDWDKYRPTMILIESLDNSLENISNNEIFIYLKPLGYHLVAKTFNTMFFKKD